MNNDIIISIKSHGAFEVKILESEKELLKKISEAVEFVESEEYIKVAEKVGHIK